MLQLFYYFNHLKGNFMRRFVQTALICMLLISLVFGGKATAAPRAQDIAKDKNVVIVIDPGHGGENLGTTENDHIEKYMTMTTAIAMYEELKLYDNVEVYLTHTDDRDMSLKQRAEYAESVEADFLFSIHYNASEYHEMYGAEVWVSAFPPFNGYGYQFGCEILKDIRDLGLLLRGVKTRLDSKGRDYYGIIREASGLGVAAVIIEHCHVDEDHDAAYCDSDEKLKAFGRMDATAAARYFGLKSSILGVDYSNYSLEETSDDEAVRMTLCDTTRPDLCEIALSYTDSEQRILALEVTAADYDSALLYYSYSLDGGKTFSAREPWPGSDPLTGEYENTFVLGLEIPSGIRPEVIVRAYNQYDLYTESNLYQSAVIFQDFQGTVSPSGAGEELPDIAKEETFSKENGAGMAELDIIPVDMQSEYDAKPEDGSSTVEVLALCLGFASILLILLTMVQGIMYHNRKNRKAARVYWRKEAGSNKNQQR